MGKSTILNNDNFACFEKRNYTDGILTLNLASWNEFHEVIKVFNNNPDYIWRGQEDEWPLKASFDRPLDERGPRYSNEKERSAKLQKIFDKFKTRLYDLPNTSTFSDDEIWAIGQHYGLPTPLLDWTESPYIAAYFAFYKYETQPASSAGNTAIYALNRDLRRLISKRINRYTREVLLRRPYVDFVDFSTNHFDGMQNKRLKNQKGKFTRSINGSDIKENVKLFYRKARLQQEIVLAKILIPQKFHHDCLQFLRSASITHGALFPDYQGAVEICKIQCTVLNETGEKKR